MVTFYMTTCNYCKKTNIPPVKSWRGNSLSRGLCVVCYGHLRHLGKLELHALPRKVVSTSKPNYAPGTRIVLSSGYVNYYPLDGGAAIAEHRYVMQQHLGRPLVKGENVHHINGVRDDNRLSNLELWHTAQPYGQRVEQLMDYIAEFHREAMLAKL